MIKYLLTFMKNIIHRLKKLLIKKQINKKLKLKIMKVK
jgi:hypothetical protein